MRWLRTISSVVVSSISGARPMRRHQLRVMSLVAGSLAVAKPRSAPVRKARAPQFRGLEDLRAVPVPGHRCRLQRAADLARGGRAGDAVVAVGIVAGEAAELVPGSLGGPGVVRGGFFRCGAARQRPELEQ